MRTEFVDLEQLERLLWKLAGLGLALALVGVLGEYLGWWNDVGELLISFGTVASVATGVVALLINATKGRVSRVADGVTANGLKLDDHGAKLDRNGRKLDRIHETQQETNGHLENQYDVLVQIRDRI